ncbi:MAG: hypothetical protein MJ245_03245 [Clostridia bacterium]|nr:hypothetical protein [Clostridia bacterium]
MCVVNTREEALEVVTELVNKRNEVKELLKVMTNDENKEFFSKYRRKIELIEILNKELDQELLGVLGVMKMDLASNSSDLMSMSNCKYYYEVGLGLAVKITKSFDEALQTYFDSNGKYLLRRRYASSNGRVNKIEDMYNFEEKIFERIEPGEEK